MRNVFRAAVMAVVVVGFVAPVAAQRDSVLCYKTKPTLFEPKLPRGVTARVEDALDPNNVLLLDPNAVPGERASFTLRKASRVCLPSEAAGVGVTDPDTHWVFYDIKAGKGGCANDTAIVCKKDKDCLDVGGACELQPKFDRKLARNTDVRVVDAFSDVLVDMSREIGLMVPATFDASAFTGVPDSSEEQLKCYAVKPTKKVCEGGAEAGSVCRRDDDCGGGTCIKLPRFPRDTHPEGLDTDVENPITLAFDAPDPDRSLDLRKLKMYCQAADTKLVGDAVDARAEDRSGLLCYAVKAFKRTCSGGDNDNGECRKDVDCPGGGVCRAEPKFDNRDPKALGFYVEDQVFQHRFDLRKEDVLCVPACKEPPAAATFSDQVMRLTALQLASGGHAFVPLASIGNPLIASSVSSGSINLLLEFDRFGDGSMLINSYTGNLDPANAGCGVNDPGQSCSYLVDASSLDDDNFQTRTSCSQAGVIVIPVEVEGTEDEPAATVAGGDEDTGFSFSFPFTANVTLQLAARDVHLTSDLTHAGGQYTGMSAGVLSGAVVHRDFKATANALPEGLCTGGGNANEECFLSDALCPGGTCSPLGGTCVGGSNAGNGCGDDSACPDPRGGNPSDACVENYIGGFTPGQVSGLIDLIARDTDLDGEKTCEGATNGGEPCDTIADCPDQNTPQGAFCDQNEASSLLLEFTAIDAAISGVAP